MNLDLVITIFSEGLNLYRSLRKRSRAIVGRLTRRDLDRLRLAHPRRVVEELRQGDGDQTPAP